MKEVETAVGIIAIIALAALALWALFCPNDKPEKNEFNLEKQTIQYECSKEFKAIKIINIIDTLKAVDAFGHKLKINEWYVQSNTTHSVFSINTKSTNYTQLDYLMANGKKEMARVKITNGDPLGAYVDAEVLLLGDKTLILNDLEQYQVVSVK